MRDNKEIQNANLKMQNEKLKFRNNCGGQVVAFLHFELHFDF